MKKITLRLLRPPLRGRAAAVVLLLSAVAQMPRWSTPTLGFVYDTDSKSIRPISGVVGAASLDGGLAVPVKLESASVSPNRQIALARTVDSDQLQLVRWKGSSGDATPLDGSIAASGLIA